MDTQKLCNLHSVKTIKHSMLNGGAGRRIVQGVELAVVSTDEIVDVAKRARSLVRVRR